jgi:hypothetical protein
VIKAQTNSRLLARGRQNREGKSYDFRIYVIIINSKISIYISMISGNTASPINTRE